MSIQHKTLVVSIPNFSHPFLGTWSKTMGLFAGASLSLYSFPSLNDTPSREIEFFTSLNTVGPQEHWKRSRILKHVSSPGYKIKTSFWKGCSGPSETGSRDGAYKKAVCVLCGGLCSSWQVYSEDGFSREICFPHQGNCRRGKRLKLESVWVKTLAFHISLPIFLCSHHHLLFLFFQLFLPPASLFFS